MKLQMGSQTLRDVQIPLLWGTRAVLQDNQGRLSVINLGGGTPRPEIIGDKPAPGTEFVPTVDGEAFKVLSNGRDLYMYNPQKKILTGMDLELPECQISDSQIRVGSNVLSRRTLVGVGVGLAVTEDGIAIGAALPPDLADLVI